MFLFVKKDSLLNAQNIMKVLQNRMIFCIPAHCSKRSSSNSSDLIVREIQSSHKPHSSERICVQRRYLVRIQMQNS